MRTFFPISLGLMILLGGCVYNHRAMDTYHQQQEQELGQEMHNYYQQWLDDDYNRLVKFDIDPQFHSIYQIRGNVQSFRMSHCDHPPFQDEEVRQRACQLADQAEAKIANTASEKVARLVKQGMSRAVAERVVRGDIRVGDDMSVINAYGAVRDFRQLHTATGVTTRTEFTDGTVVYEHNGKVIAVSN